MTTFRRVVKALLRILVLSLVGAVGLGAYFGYRLYKSFESDLPPNLDAVTDYRPLRASQVFSADGELIGVFFVEKRVLTPVEQIPQLARRAFVAAEDERFYSHGGIDYLSIMRAAWANFRAGHVVQGGSTITQQVAKLLIVGQERSLSRKIREAMLAHRIEGRLSKDQILGIYLNHVYLGHGAYGIAAAANAYFGKAVKDLSIAEAAMLAAQPKAPGKSTPYHDYARAKGRQSYVLEQMKSLGFISEAEALAAKDEPLVLVSRNQSLRNVAAPYFVEMIRRHVAENYGDEELLRRGLKIHTTLDMRRQRAAEAAVRTGLEDLQRRVGFDGPIARLDPEQRRRLLRGRPRPFGPTGFLIDDEEQDEHMLLPGLRAPGESVEVSAAPVIDATRPGGNLSESMARSALSAAKAQARQAARAGRKGAKAPAAPAFETDPDLTYAAVVTALGNHQVQVASGAITAVLDPPDAARVVGWKERGGRRVAPGDVLPVRFKPAPPRGRPDRLGATLALSPVIQGALVAVDPSNGHMVSMVGGYDYGKSQFNRAWQAHRQIGSAMKPFIYAAAIERGMTELTVKWDAPVKFKTSSGIWAPKNYKREFLGPLTLRTALAKSINTISAQLTAQMGVDAVIEMMRNLGVKSALPHAMSLSLGTADLTLQEVAYGIAAFPAGGEQVTPVFVTKVVDADGRVLEDRTGPQKRPRRLSPETAYIVSDMMRGVVESGTGRKARELGRPAAGKTGTSTNYRDTWFFGFTPELVCGVWVGRDDFKPIAHEATGGQVALPIWLAYMRVALEGQPVRELAPPPGIVFVRANPESGAPATPQQGSSRLIPFKRGTLPGPFKTGALGAQFSDEQF